MERVNAPTKDKDGGAIRDPITRYFAEYLQDNGKIILSINLPMVLNEKLKGRLTNFKPGIKDKEIWLGDLIRTLN